MSDDKARKEKEKQKRCIVIVIYCNENICLVFRRKAKRVKMKKIRNGNDPKILWKDILEKDNIMGQLN